MKVTDRPSPNLDFITIDGQFVLFDPAFVDLSNPDSANEHVIRSDVNVSLEDWR